MAGMAGMAVRRKEWQNSRMAETATYVLFMVHTDNDDDGDDDDNDTLIFYSIDILSNFLLETISTDGIESRSIFVTVFEFKDGIFYFPQVVTV